MNKTDISKMIKEIGNVERNIAEKYLRLEDMVGDILETMSQNIPSASYDVCIGTGIAEEIDEDREYPYCLCIRKGSFCIMQDQDPGFKGFPGHEYTQISLKDIDYHDLVELILRIPQVLEAMLEELGKEKENCSEAQALLQKIQEVIQE